jgi:hypothetical protein
MFFNLFQAGSFFRWHGQLPGRPPARRAICKRSLRLEVLEPRDLLSAGVAGYVFGDTNGNGLPDRGEQPLAQVRVELHDSAHALVRVATTDARGYYQFGAQLPPDRYTVVLPAVPAGYLPGQVSRAGVVLPGSAGTPSIPVGLGKATPANADPDEPDNDADDPGDFAHNDFGLLPAAHLAGLVYLEGAPGAAPGQQPTGMPGVAVTLAGTDDRGHAVRLTITTGEDGSFRFTGLRPGKYALTATTPAGYREGNVTPGTLGGTREQQQLLLTVGPGADGAGYDFGEQRIPTPPLLPVVPGQPPPAPASVPHPFTVAVQVPGVAPEKRSPGTGKLPVVVYSPGLPGTQPGSPVLNTGPINQDGSPARGTSLLPGAGGPASAPPPGAAGVSFAADDSPETAEDYRAPFLSAPSQAQALAFLENNAGKIPDEGAANDSWILSEERQAKKVPDTWVDIDPLPRSRGHSRALSRHPDEQASSFWITSLWVIGTAIATASIPPEDSPEVASARGPGRRNGPSA